MQLRKWNELPKFMRTREVRKYYNIVNKRREHFLAGSDLPGDSGFSSRDLPDMFQLLAFGAFQPPLPAVGHQDVRTVCFHDIKQLSLVPAGYGEDYVRFTNFHTTAPR